jgi:predicted nucleic acid-binding protein
VAVLIDTSILVASEREHIRLEDLVDPTEQYAISIVTAAELLHGVHRASGRRAQARSAYVEALLATFSALPVDIIVARAYAQASAALARAGTQVDANDLWIGATAIAHGLGVLALDGDFDRIPGVTRLALA